MLIKDIIRNILISLRLDVTKNIKYDRLTHKIIQRVITNASNCIDIGCHKGEILELILRYAPNGQHFAFEPIPELFDRLQNNLDQSVTLYPYALSDKAGVSSFQWVKNAPAYSGLKKRRYDINTPDIEEIKVEVRLLDELIPPEVSVDFIKIDVEGGEFGVLQGAKRILKTYQPTVLFECGQGASDYYGTAPEDIHQYLNKECGLSIHTLGGFLSGKTPITQAEFKAYFVSNQEYYFVASK